MTRPATILVTGGSGQVGFELKRALVLHGRLICPDRSRFDLAQPATLAAALDAWQPGIIVNPAAYTAVDRAEDEPALAHAINAEAVAELARWAAANNALLLHYSTDYVFDGNKDDAWREDDDANPQSVYGLSKWRGEQAIRDSGCRHFILRTSWVAGVYGQNFLKTMLRLATSRDSLSVVADQFGAPTPASLLADVAANLVARCQADADQPYGTYHVAARGRTSWHEYAGFVIALARDAGWPLALTDATRAIASRDYPQKAARPANSQLDCNKLMQTFGLSLPDWQDAVRQLFQTIDNARKP
ncbi:dTDP-4-dehydrorhamnose reductase [Vogesella indigofera]|uniref:dTDP-4-dehydrorhamnose reductase n=1 Tax=Vogesella indigofera TaxID=45465 RepID=A0ABT5I5W4_VOGIN|nr:dTDP-4-dehydrorhamnose reductase [Vogesella indigofera]MDC7691565.1 dTDP-4-dehydrorhamnose reductase [Vogesella indigofera]